FVRSEDKGKFFRLKIKIDVQKPLRRGIFVSTGNQDKVWLSFNYENLPIFCFGCGRLGHGVKECNEIKPLEREKVEDEQPYSVALKAESNLLGKESQRFGSVTKKSMKQRYYTGKADVHKGGESPSRVVPKPGQQRKKKMESVKDSIILESNNVQQKFRDIENGECLGGPVVSLKMKENNSKKRSWLRAERTEFSGMYMEETVSGKRKCDTKQLEEMDNFFVGNVLKKPKFDGEGLGVSVLSDSLKPILEHDTSTRACRRLRLTLKSHNPHIVFLMETKLDGRRMEKFHRKCGFMNGIDVQAKGFSKSHIDVDIIGGDDNLRWRFTDFYGSLVARDRQGSWELIRKFKSDCNMPWIICGDFNEILHSHEKQGGNLPKINIRERLDRGVVNTGWLNLFLIFSIDHLPHSFSDHCPLLVKTNKGANYRSKKKFSFEARWVLNDSCKDVIREVWETTSNDLAKLEALRSALMSGLKL
ncbi:hypothetical protein Gogos_021703, partial [Gossypium gossypioides]|nr:hypothetical protein [Gossypium gossypioides]